MMDEYYDLPEAPLFDFLNQFKSAGIEVNSIKDIDKVVKQLEEFHLFESASDLRAWHNFLQDCVTAEFNENCLLEPIFPLDASAYLYNEEHILGDGWLHEWELPPHFKFYEF